MKILSIRGKNLASLESFEVDLESGPLEHVGIFAITGPTGAGKTTLLDALCVALFDRTPRLSNLAGVPVGTADQEEAHRVRANDVRGMLRRGAGEGFAEVDFVGRDGRAYRAKWAVHRSRRRASGKLQNSEVSLTDLETEQVFTGKKRETLEAIEDRLGLSFEQFRRSALLAQNDFAAFLRADKEQRSDLLERMTGTEIYTRLSMAAYRRAVDEAKGLSLLEETADSSAILDDEVRETLAAKRDELRKQHKKQQAALQEAHTSLTWFGESRKADAAVAEAKQAAIRAAKEFEALQPTAKRISAVRLAREQRSLVDAASNAHKQAAEALSRVEQAKEEQASAEARAKASHEAVVTAKAAVASAREQHIASLKLEHAKNASRMSDLTAWIDEHKELAASGGEVAEFASLSVEELDARRPILEEQVAKTLHEATALRAVELDLLETRNKAKKAVDEASVLAASSELASVRAEHTLVTQQHTGIQRLLDMAKVQSRASALQKCAEEEGKSAAVEMARLAADLKVHAAEDKTCAASLEEATAAFDRIRLALDLADHRTNLVDGEHCPLCGSKEHPWRENRDTARVVGEQEERVRALREELEIRRKAGAEIGSLLKSQEHVLQRASDEAKVRSEEVQSAKTQAEEERSHSYFDNFTLSLRDDALDATAKSTSEKLANVRDKLAAAEALDATAREASSRAAKAAAAWALASENRQEAERIHQGMASKLSACQGYRYRSRATELSRLREAQAVCEEKLDAAPSWLPETEQAALAKAIEVEEAANTRVATASAALRSCEARVVETAKANASANALVDSMLEKLGVSKVDLLERLSVTDAWVSASEASVETANRTVTATTSTLKERELRCQELLTSKPAGTTEEEAAKHHAELNEAFEALVEEGVSIGSTLRADEEARKRRSELGAKISVAVERVRVFRTLSDLIGSADGKKFRVFAQSLTLESLLVGANTHLKELAPRYLLERVPGHDLDLQVIDRDLADEVRSVNSLSGGESFLISLALALGLSSLAAKDVQVESLLVDEGFGSLDGDTLEVALSVLDSLQATGRKVGLISHVPGFAERIGAQVIVTPQGGGRSTVRVQGPMSYG